VKHSFKVVIDENRFWDLYNNPIEPACKNQPILRTEYEIILEKIKTLANSHLEAILSNGKSLYITRKYLTDIKRILQENN